MNCPSNALLCAVPVYDQTAFTHDCGEEDNNASESRRYGVRRDSANAKAGPGNTRHDASGMMDEARVRLKF